MLNLRIREQESPSTPPWNRDLLVYSLCRSFPWPGVVGSVRTDSILVGTKPGLVSLAHWYSHPSAGAKALVETSRHPKTHPFNVNQFPSHKIIQSQELRNTVHQFFP